MWGGGLFGGEEGWMGGGGERIRKFLRGCGGEVV